MRRIFFASFVPVAAVGIALARGRKTEEVAPPPPPPPVAAPAAAEPPAPPAPKLFPDGLPVVISTLPAGLPSLSAQGCNACHGDAHDTWLGSAHAHAGESAAFRDAVRTAGNSTACTQCHLPLATQHDPLAAGYIDGDLSRPRLEPNPSFDATLRGEGVTCVACHVRDGVVLGVHASTNAPHPLVVSAELTDSAMCATCHQLTWAGADRPFYDTYGEWKASAYGSAGVSCQACHSGHADPDPRRALSALLHLDHPSLQRGQPVPVKLTLQNTGAGHHFPTGNPWSEARIDVVLLDGAGKDLAPAFSTVLAREVEPTAPYRTLSDNRLAAGAQMSLAHDFIPNVKGVPGRGAVEVLLTRDGETIVLTRVGVDVL